MTRRGGSKYYPSKEGNLSKFTIYLTKGEHICARRCSYLIPSCRSKNGKANVTYFYRVVIRRAMKEIINRAGGQQKFIERTNREEELVTQKRDLIRAYRRNRTKRRAGVKYI